MSKQPLTIKHDYLVIGQGLAGSLFAHQLRNNKHSFKVIDSGKQGASYVCGGMYNPVVLRRYAEVWQAELQINYTKKILKELEKQLGKQLDYPQPIYRLFNNENDKLAWVKKTKSLEAFLSKEVVDECHVAICSPFGLGKVKMSGKVAVKTLLNGFRKQLSKNDELIESTMNYSELKIDANEFEYKGQYYKQVVCCEGFGLKNNPFFKDLPLNGNKGETIYIKAPKLDLSVIVKCGIFIAPTTEKDIYLVGATYDWDNKNSIPTEQAKQTLMNKLSQFLTVDFEVVKHLAGVRPTVSDRRPLLGKHPKIKNLYVLNGLGTRGVMLGPIMAHHLYQYISENIPLPEEVDIQRFNKMRFN